MRYFWLKSFSNSSISIFSGRYCHFRSAVRMLPFSFTGFGFTNFLPSFLALIAPFSASIFVCWATFLIFRQKWIGNYALFHCLPFGIFSSCATVLFLSSIAKIFTLDFYIFYIFSPNCWILYFSNWICFYRCISSRL